MMCTTWKGRPISPEAASRMTAAWGKLEADLTENPDFERVCWYMFGDGSGGSPCRGWPTTKRLISSDWRWP